MGNQTHVLADPAELAALRLVGGACEAPAVCAAVCAAAEPPRADLLVDAFADARDPLRPLLLPSFAPLDEPALVLVWLLAAWEAVVVAAPPPAARSPPPPPPPPPPRPCAPLPPPPPLPEADALACADSLVEDAPCDLLCLERAGSAFDRRFPEADAREDDDAGCC